MDNRVNPVDPCDPLEAYIRPIRSVLFIDDQFPTFADVHQAVDTDAPRFKEADRARALWRACVERGWLCDIDNSAEWASPERRRRLAACDLLVLDLHLVGQDSRPALSIVRDLACSEAPNLVVVYTADPKPDQALMAIAASARGVSADALKQDIDPEIEALEMGWTKEDILAFITGTAHWKGTYITACRSAGLPADESTGRVLLERWLADNLGAHPTERLLPIDKVQCSESRWLQCGNLFVVVIPKPPEQVVEEESRIVLDGLEAAIKEWAPPWLACLIASSRRSVETGSFRDDGDLPPEPLQAGLLRYIRATDDVEERTRRAREVTSHMLARRFNQATGMMSEQLRRRADMDLSVVPRATGDEQTQLLHLNAFLCSEPFSRHHLRVGSIFRANSTYWVCVTPACDMVPRDRKRSRSIDPWAADLDPVRPMLALRLDIRRKITEPLNKAEQGRFLFFWDTETQKDTPIIAASFNTVTGDPNPQLEQMFAANRARVKDGKVRLQRCISGQDGESVTTETLECVVISQLRAPYAERLTHIAGHHLSRIGVNFLRLLGEEAEEQG
jgi:hypothetical protein